ncbi:MAG: PDZ domain-containing protein [Phycisphaeraceae bacterium]|nr:PDZ domain-containing protein [Phycisphaeraceae bacterium]
MLGAAPQGRPDRAVAPPREAAAVSAELERQVDALVDRLASPEWEERESASAALMALPMPEAQPVLLRRLERGGLDPEQRHRLADAACRRLVEQPRGALGISMDIGPQGMSGVRVMGLVPGMPAAEVLRIGDVIEAINDEPILSSQVLSDVVQRLAPGTAVHLRVQRPVLDEQGRPRRDRAGQVVTQAVQVTMRLGSMEQLDANDRMGRERNAFRRSSDVQILREAEARRIRRDFVATATLVPLTSTSRDGPVVEMTFAGRLAELERRLDELEDGIWRTRGDAIDALSATAQGLDALQAHMNEESVTDRDRVRLAGALQRLGRLLSRDDLLMPVDQQIPPR